MTPIYLEYTFTVTPVQPGSDILIAQLGQIGFESFIENENGITAYIQKEEAFANKQHTSYQDVIKDVALLDASLCEISFTAKEIEQVNWNEEWEKHFDPIEVDGKCTVRAPFHPKTTTAYDIVIEPKMSFGTGHHETTHMMIKHLLKMDLSQKKTLDMGSGTGVLAILAEMRGAGPIDAIDIDHWCYLNAKENAARNNCRQITVLEGDVALLKDKAYDVIIANINRNILLQDIPTYAKCLPVGGVLLLSGFYLTDLDQITAVCNTHDLYFVQNYERNDWIACRFEKRG